MHDKRNASAIAAYRHAGMQAGVEGANRHQLIVMLFNGALDHLARARGLLERADMAGKGEQLGFALEIIAGLRNCLDKERGGELAERLDSLYDYMERRLTQANLENRQEMVDEVAALMTQIRDGWTAIPTESEVAQ